MEEEISNVEDPIGSAMGIIKTALAMIMPDKEFDFSEVEALIEKEKNGEEITPEQVTKAFKKIGLPPAMEDMLESRMASCGCGGS